LHARPHIPQWATFVRVSTSHPLAGLLSQLPKPAVQLATVHVPLAQLSLALGRLHARPHAPQWAAVVARAVSQPLAGLLSQLPKPAVQLATVHAPFAQPSLVLGRLHARPHIPQ
jgi:hypothetical protein